VIADMSLAVATYVVVPDQGCGVVNERSCDDKGLATVYFGVPLLLVAAIAGGYGLANQPTDDAASPPTESDELPAITTDLGTLQLARQVAPEVRARQCVAARTTMNRIAARDAEYHIAMLAKGALGTCVTDEAGTQ
jgi:hypothetical protein